MAMIKRKQLQPAPTIVLFGDSITNRNADLPSEEDTDQTLPHAQYSATGFFTWANVMLRHKFRVIYEYGIGGRTTATMLANVGKVVEKKPGFCFVLGGINDVSTGVSATTIIANLKAIYETLKINNIRVIAGTILPATVADTVAKKAALHAVNRWMKEYAWNNPNIVLVDWHTIMADPTTGAPLAAYTQDGTHPNIPCVARLGQFLAPIIDPLVPDIDLLQNNIQDTDNIVSNGFMTGDAAGKATGWSSGGTTATTAWTKVARTDNIPGEWQQAVASTEGTVAFYQTVTIAGKINVGDVFYAQMEFETDNDIVGQTKFHLFVDQINDASATLATSGDNVWNSNEGNADLRMASGVLRTPEMTVVTGTTKFVYQFNARFEGAGCGGTIRLGRAEIRKVNY